MKKPMKLVLGKEKEREKGRKHSVKKPTRGCQRPLLAELVIDLLEALGKKKVAALRKRGGNDEGSRFPKTTVTCWHQLGKRGKEEKWPGRKRSGY